VSDKPLIRPASYLAPGDFHRLSWACRPIKEGFDHYPYLVGSVMTTPHFRDIDLRLILPDKEYRRLAPNRQRLLLLNVAISDLIAKAAGLAWPIDFQFQSQTEADADTSPAGMRNPMGMIR
jgi:hypothetical protein